MRISATITGTVLLLVSVLPVPTAAAQQRPQPATVPVGSVTLSLECRSAEQVAFTIRNVGTEDTALMLGGALSNGRKYMLVSLTLLAESRAESRRYEYFPPGYPVRIGGNLEEWIEPLPVRASYTMALEPRDFRLGAWPAGERVSLRLDVHPPMQQGIRLLAYWFGVLSSNALRVPEDCDKR